MTSHRPNLRLHNVPWGAIAGELVTTACFGFLSLFFPFLDWVQWPALLFTWHFAVVVIGSLATAIALARRRPESLKAAVILAAYIGLPSLMNMSQVLGLIRSATDDSGISLLNAIWGLGMLGQVAVVVVLS